MTRDVAAAYHDGPGDVLAAPDLVDVYRSRSRVVPCCNNRPGKHYWSGGKNSYQWLGDGARCDSRLGGGSEQLNDAEERERANRKSWNSKPKITTSISVVCVDGAAAFCAPLLAMPGR